MNDTTATAPMPLVLFGVPFHNVSFNEAVAWAVTRMRSGKPGYIATANLDFVMQAWRDPELQRILLEADLVVADGQPLVRFSSLFGPRLKERVTGSDLAPMLAEACRDQGLKPYLLGAGPGVAQRAGEELQRRYPGLEIAGCHSPPPADLLDMDHGDTLGRLSTAKPDLLLVAFGSPKQEKWINMHVRDWDVPLAIGVGGTLDFLAGAQTRAPRWVQRAGVEWVWRLGTNPRRLFRRYAANLRFLVAALARLLPLRFGLCTAKSVPVKAPPTAALDRLDADWVRFPRLPNEAAASAFVAKHAATEGSRSLIIDLHGVRWLSSLELGALVQLGRARRDRWRRVFLWTPSKRVGRLLHTCRLDLYLTVEDSPARLVQALEALAERSRVGQAALERPMRLHLRLPLELTAANLPEFRRMVDAEWTYARAAGGPHAVLVDGAGVQFIDSAALGFLVGLRRRAEQTSVGLHCVGFRNGALQTVKLARLESLLAMQAG